MHIRLRINPRFIFYFPLYLSITEQFNALLRPPLIFNFFIEQPFPSEANRPVVDRIYFGRGETENELTVLTYLLFQLLFRLI